MHGATENNPPLNCMVFGLKAEIEIFIKNNEHLPQLKVRGSMNISVIL